MLRKATSADRPALERLLADAKLPLAGLPDTHLLVVEDDGRLVGAIGFERHGSIGLLRSLVVHPDHRGAGLGGFLLDAGLKEMQRAGLREAYGLTETIAPWLERLGWDELPQKGLPAELLASKELQGACADTARAFHTKL